MISVFDIQKLRGFLRDFYALTQIRIMVYDDQFRELCAYPEERSPICQQIRKNLRADDACRACDRAACKAASRLSEPYIYTCHAGLTEAISTLRVDNVIVGYLSFGHLFSYDSHEAGWPEIWARVAQYGMEEETVRQACGKLPIHTRAYILSAAHILHAVASQLILERMAVIRQEGIEVQLDRYLTAHYTEPITPEALCDHFHIGRTKLYEIVRQSYGRGLSEHVRHLRMERAKELLLDRPELTVAEVAMACGYDDYNYFISLFARAAGMPPKRYRQTRLDQRT